MVAQKYNMTIEQGSTFEREFDVSEIFPSLASYTVRMQARPSVASSTKYLDLSSDTSGISIDLTDRIVTVSLSAATTLAQTWTDAVYDMEFVSGSGVVTRLLEGTLFNSFEVTR